VRIDNVFDHRLRFAAHLLPVGHAEAELGEHLLMRNRLVVLAPFVGFGDRLRFGRDQQSTGLLPFLLTAIGRRDQGGVHRRQNDAERVSGFRPALLSRKAAHCRYNRTHDYKSYGAVVNPVPRITKNHAGVEKITPHFIRAEFGSVVLVLNELVRHVHPL
jgi:hypothetical protein